jgi:hypothetical protein
MPRGDRLSRRADAAPHVSSNRVRTARAASYTVGVAASPRRWPKVGAFGSLLIHFVRFSVGGSLRTFCNIVLPFVQATRILIGRLRTAVPGCHSRGRYRENGVCAVFLFTVYQADGTIQVSFWRMESLIHLTACLSGTPSALCLVSHMTNGE